MHERREAGVARLASVTPSAPLLSWEFLPRNSYRAVSAVGCNNLTLNSFSTTVQ